MLKINNAVHCPDCDGLLMIARSHVHYERLIVFVWCGKKMHHTFAGSFNVYDAIYHDLVITQDMISSKFEAVK